MHVGRKKEDANHDMNAALACKMSAKDTSYSYGAVAWLATPRAQPGLEDGPTHSNI
jgi:hypothetical protein